MRWTKFLVTCGFAAVCALNASAQLYTQTFEVDDTANWTVNDPAVTDILVDFYYDYADIGVPAAPGGVGTRGLKMTANNATGVFGGFSVSPNGQNFTGDYVVSFDLWSNYVGPLGPGGSGTTQLSLYGLETSGTEAVWPGSSPKESIMFANTLDGGSAADYRVYTSAFPFSVPSGDPIYAAPSNSNNGSDPHYAVFGGASAPGDQVTLFPGQTGVTSSGETAFRWVNVELSKIGDTVTWEMDGLLIATLDASTLTLGGGNILFGHSDTNNGSSVDPNATLLNVTLIDNVNVSVIPEPASGLLMLLGGLLGLVRRRR